MVKVGVVIPQYGVSFRTVFKFARISEKLGYDSLWIEDHLTPWQLPPGKGALECFTTLSYIASITKKPLIGTLVTNVIYRHPAILAKSAATIDRISGGRLVLGLGLGWYEDEIRAFNIPYPPLKQRIEMLSELIDYLKKLWASKGKVNFKGKYFKLERAYFNPKPIQKPYPPIIIGTGGEKKMLKLVAEKADGWNYGALTPEEFKRKALVLRKHCESVGRDFNEIEKSLELYVFIAETLEKAETMKKHYWEAIPKGNKLQHIIQDIYMKTALTGSPGDVEAQLKEYIRAGVDHFTLVFPGKYRLEMLEIFGKKVLSNL